MKDYIKQNKILLAAMALVFIACFIVIGTRYSIESKNKTYDIVLDYNEIAALALQTEHDVSWWLGKFKGMGITKVGLPEESLLSLMDDKDIHLTAKIMDIITKEAAWKDAYPAEILDKLNEKGYVPYDVMVEIEGADTVSFVLEAMRARFQPNRYYMLDMGDKAYVLIYGTPDITLYTDSYKIKNSRGGGFIQNIDLDSSKIMYISLGLLPQKVEIIQNLGMQIIPRTMSYKAWNDTKYGQAVIDGYEKYGIVPEYMIVGGEAVIGLDDELDFARDYMIGNGITVGLIENTTQLQNILQLGVLEVAAESGYDAVRVFSVWNYIQYRYQYYGYEGAEEIENTLFRAVTERNIRVIYFKPAFQFKDLHTYVTDVSVYEGMFENLEKRLADHGIRYASASVMDDYKVSLLFKILFGIGAVIGAVLLLRSFLPLSQKVSLILAALGAICVPAAFYVMPNTAELIASLAAAIVFGCLATTYFTAQSRYYSEKMAKNTGLLKIMKVSILTLIAAVAIALLGGLLTAAPISSVNYMLEINIFRGVKIGQLLPIAYFVIAYLAYFGYGDRKTTPGNLELGDLKDLFNANIKVWMMVLAFILGGMGAYYIMRTGHDSSIEVTSYEMLFRNELENILLARPRTKEFLLAFPAIMMMVYASIRGFKKWAILFGLGGVVGVTSVINTFEHIRTPLYLGFVRTGYSLLFGIIIGIMAILVFEAMYRAYNQFLRKYIEAGSDG